MSFCFRCRTETAEPTLVFFEGKEGVRGLCSSCLASLKTWLRGEEVETLAQLRTRVPWGILGGLRGVPVALGAGCTAGLSLSVEAWGWAFVCVTDCDPGLTLDVAYQKQIPLFPTAVPVRRFLSFEPFRVRMGELVNLTIENGGPFCLRVRSWNLMGIREEDMTTALKDPAVASFLRRRWPRADFQERSTLLDAAMERIEEITRKTRTGLTPKEREVLDLLQSRASSRLTRSPRGVLSIDPGIGETIPATVLDYRTEAEAHQNPGSELACPGFGPGAKGPRCCDLAGEPGICGDCHCACHAGKSDATAAPTAAENAYRSALYDGQALVMESLIEHLERLKTQAEGVAALWEKTDVTPKEAYRQGIDDTLASVMQGARALLLVAKKKAPPGV